MKKKRRESVLDEVGEDGIIRYLRSRHAASGGRISLGIGDDTALFNPHPGKRILFTTDLMVEGVHFSRAWIPPEDLGYKLAAVNVSDIAAMGGKPTFALLSLALPRELEFDFVRRLSRGLRKAERTFGLELIGGDTTSSKGGVFACISLLGTLQARRPLTRSGACPGDGIYVTGHLGASVLGLEALELGKGYRDTPALRGAVRKHLRPSPPLSWALTVARRNLATAAMDVSDGLSVDLGRLCKASRVGAEIETAALPVLPGTRKAAEAVGKDAGEAALHGGEEYELLFTVRPRKELEVQRLARRERVRVSRVGTVLRQKKIFTVSRGGRREPLVTRGWEHFP
jgi:thiamine-monophosphate kinase